MNYRPQMGPTRFGLLRQEHVLAPQTMVGASLTVDRSKARSPMPDRRRFRLTMSISKRLMPERMVVSVSASRCREGGVELFFRNLRPFDMARPKQYAWQRDYDGQRPIHVPLGEVSADTATIDRLMELLDGPRRSCFQMVRVEPEGIRVRVLGPRDRPGRSVPSHVDELLKPLAQAAPYTPDRPRLEGDRASTPEPQDRKETNMLIPAGTKIVGCEFSGSVGKQYAYYTDLDLAVGDYVVVVSPYDGHYNSRNSRGTHYDERLEGHLQVVKVVSVEETLEGVERAARWVVQRVDVSAYAERVEAQKKVALLTAKIKKAERAAREQLELEKLRDLSPELGSLIDELKELTGSGPAKAD